MNYTPASCLHLHNIVKVRPRSARWPRTVGKWLLPDLIKLIHVDVDSYYQEEPQHRHFCHRLDLELSAQTWWQYWWTCASRHSEAGSDRITNRDEALRYIINPFRIWLDGFENRGLLAFFNLMVHSQLFLRFPSFWCFCLVSYLKALQPVTHRTHHLYLTAVPKSISHRRKTCKSHFLGNPNAWAKGCFVGCDNGLLPIGCSLRWMAWDRVLDVPVTHALIVFVVSRDAIQRLDGNLEFVRVGNNLMLVLWVSLLQGYVHTTNIPSFFLAVGCLVFAHSLSCFAGALIALRCLVLSWLSRRQISVHFVIFYTVPFVHTQS